MASTDELAEKAKIDDKIEAFRADITHLSEKLQRLLDSFLDGVLERDIYTQKKAEIMSQKKTSEEQMNDLALGNLEWVEPHSQKQKHGRFQQLKNSSPPRRHLVCAPRNQRKRAHSRSIFEKSLVLEPRLGFEPRTPSLPWKCSTTELSRLVVVQGVGFEPTNSERADLQSAVFDRFTNPAWSAFVVKRCSKGAGWSRLSDSNRRPSVYKTDALTS